MAQGFFNVDSNNWTAQNFSAGQWSIKLQNTNATLLVSENANGEVIFNSKDFNNGVIPINVDAQKDFYFKVSGDIDNAKVFYCDSFFFRVKGGGGGVGVVVTTPLQHHLLIIKVISALLYLKVLRLHKIDLT